MSAAPVDREPQTEPERVAAFLADLRKASLRHGVIVAGCGCCGSPRIVLLRKADTKKMRGRYRTGQDGRSNLEWE